MYYYITLNLQNDKNGKKRKEKLFIDKFNKYSMYDKITREKSSQLSKCTSQKQNNCFFILDHLLTFFFKYISAVIFY